PDFRDLVTMGDLASQALGRQIYSLAFTCYDGKTGFVDYAPYTLDRPPAGSLETLWAGTSHQLSFVAFRNPALGGEWLHKPIASWVVRHEEIVTTDWSQIIDGMVFVRTMRPATPIN